MYKNGLGEALHVLHSAGYAPTVRFTTRAGGGGRHRRRERGL